MMRSVWSFMLELRDLELSEWFCNRLGAAVGGYEDYEIAGMSVMEGFE